MQLTHVGQDTLSCDQTNALQSMCELPLLMMYQCDGINYTYISSCKLYDSYARKQVKIKMINKWDEYEFSNYQGLGDGSTMIDSGERNGD